MLPLSCPGQWNAYVESGASREERAARLASVPRKWRKGVESHVSTAFAVRLAQRGTRR